MTLLEKFNIVDLNGRMNLTNEDGEFIVSRVYYNQKINLYALPGFYVEVYYQPDINKIIKIEAITSHDELNKYLPYIDILLWLMELPLSKPYTEC